MSHWESPGKSDEWLTPAYIFDALGEEFDVDVAHACVRSNVPARSFIAEDSLSVPWYGFVWMNPPFGGRNGLIPWLDKFFRHRHGIALVPDRTSAPWCQDALRRCTSALFVAPKVKFERIDGSVGAWPSTGTVLFAAGARADGALLRAQERQLGTVMCVCRP